MFKMTGPLNSPLLHGRVHLAVGGVAHAYGGTIKAFAGGWMLS